jgi:mannitol-1-/sugar-/sorbitol-6-phosphatase
MDACCAVRVDAVLFDLDGVLVDSTAAVEGHWRAFAARHHLDEDELLADLHGRRMVEIMAAAAPWMDAAQLRAEGARLEAEEAAGARAGTVAQPGALALVASLTGRRWAVATSGTRPVAVPRLEAVGLPLPAVLVTAEDVTRGKPDPAPYLLAARRLGVQPARCAVIEDAPAGVRAGAAAGAVTIAVTTSHAAAELQEADHVVGTTADLRLTAGSDGMSQLAIACSAGCRCNISRPPT